MWWLLLEAQRICLKYWRRRSAPYGRGSSVVFPTDTVYGVAALAEDVAAVETLFAAKGRDTSVALPVMVAEMEQVTAVAHLLPGFEALATAFWPGPLTIILPKTAALPDIVTGGGDTVGLRVPNHELVLALLRTCASPLAVTSANRSGQPPAQSAAAALDQLGGRAHIILDGGLAPGGQPSTVLDLTTDPPMVRRSGPISPAALAACLQRQVKIANDSEA